MPQTMVGETDQVIVAAGVTDCSADVANVDDQEDQHQHRRGPDAVVADAGYCPEANPRPRRDQRGERHASSSSPPTAPSMATRYLRLATGHRVRTLHSTIGVHRADFWRPPEQTCRGHRGPPTARTPPLQAAFHPTCEPTVHNRAAAPPTRPITTRAADLDCY